MPGMTVSRKRGQKIVCHVGQETNVTITVVAIHGNRACINVEAPSSVRLMREEIDQPARFDTSPAVPATTPVEALTAEDLCRLNDALPTLEHLRDLERLGVIHDVLGIDLVRCQELLARVHGLMRYRELRRTLEWLSDAESDRRRTTQRGHSS